MAGHADIVRMLLLAVAVSWPVAAAWPASWWSEPAEAALSAQPLSPSPAARVMPASVTLVLRPGWRLPPGRWLDDFDTGIEQRRRRAAMLLDDFGPATRGTKR